MSKQNRLTGLFFKECVQSIARGDVKERDVELIYAENAMLQRGTQEALLSMFMAEFGFDTQEMRIALKLIKSGKVDSGSAVNVLASAYPFAASPQNCWSKPVGAVWVAFPKPVVDTVEKSLPISLPVTRWQPSRAFNVPIQNKLEKKKSNPQHKEKKIWTPPPSRYTGRGLIGLNLIYCIKRMLELGIEADKVTCICSTTTYGFNERTPEEIAVYLERYAYKQAWGEEHARAVKLVCALAKNGKISEPSLKHESPPSTNTGNWVYDGKVLRRSSLKDDAELKPFAKALGINEDIFKPRRAAAEGAPPSL